MPVGWLAILGLVLMQVNASDETLSRRGGDESDAPLAMLPRDPAGDDRPTDWLNPANDPGASFLTSEPPPLDAPMNRMSIAWLAPGSSRGFGTTDLDFNRTWSVELGAQPPVLVTPGLGFHLWAGPRDVDLPARVYDLYLDVSWRPIDRETWGLAGGITPGFYGDFVRFDGNAFQITGWLLANYRPGPRWNLLGGVAYIRQLGDHLLPVGGVVWTPDDDTKLELLVPKSRFVRRLRGDETGATWWYVAAQLGGGAWSVADTPAQSVLVGYSDFRVLMGLESFHTSGLEWTCDLGYVFHRSLAVDGGTVASPDATFLLQVGLAF